MKRLLVYMLAGMSLIGTSCSDFLETIPHDALSPSTTWQTEADAEKFLIGCYDGWADESGILYWDCGSDFGFNYHIHEGWRNIGNGSMTASNQVAGYYSFSMIRRCNDFLTNIANIEFAEESKKNNMIGQVKTIRAYQYFLMNWIYGGVPIIESYETAEEAQVPRNSEEEVKNFIYNELDEAIPMLYDAPEASGYIAKGTALALNMRASLFYGDYQRAKDAAKAIMDLGIYELDPSYENLFTLAGQNSKEIIASVQHDENLYSNWMIATMYNNADGGWSSMVPTQNLVDTYEMSNGLTKEEAGSGYDATHPFANRDPRMAMTVLYPGMDWVGLTGKTILNTLDATIDGAKNPNYPDDADNASKTALTWAKYLNPYTQYGDIWSTNAQPIVFRYAEVLLSYAEAENELNGPSAEVYNLLNQVRNRVGMPDVDQNKYNNQAKLRELIRRERSVELAGEGLRRQDIIRWKDDSGKMLAETVLNGPLTRVVGTVNTSEPDPTKRATISGTALVENRAFASYNRYLPIPQSAIDKNPNLKQNEGY
ncbi:MAG: RagB/SusD family nutrient uptake outer membrane protein [Parabacteroides sp.]|uniref:RagB/SusD family nutrient uptake outer membrane protein n=1 Tax=Parabacteroides faecalis TaxID=2924040 RepID=A0ABT0BZT8_9BACT|nr:RagB/SusD family nutrient uptake outer membrane protein [Parabacteroides faecalis]MCI7286205.1 RagB/SusD family nutrient uptake outer membrane protein [Parabacteroides sp.]MDY5621828.1 RagB/SusD family nutrient uptake outer membrane protein [Bacteroidales bacterium]CDE65224.1 susD family protein [Parabacteroides sp. CAG:409]MCI7705543.1 RagB/SusD family nutrient uptake outer membrane protein [Parabacteroides sp.]MCJ2380185.1 RagB/SusD family nutrient uptake outer membrane protein [Parabacte